MKKMNTRMTVSVGMLSSIAYLLMLINFPLPIFPAFLLVDFSDVPALLGTLLFGPLAGILIELIKNILDYLFTGSETGVPIGHLANFLAGVFIILPFHYVVKKFQSKNGVLVGLLLGVLVMAVLMSILNYFVFLPAYSYFLNYEPMASSEMRKYIVATILPFNAIKGLIISGVFILLYAPLKTWIERQRLVKI
ncbi:riboflavin transporter FmnP [Bacillus coahuilensis m2-6]|uniref:Riboflavin transporter n=1 Tax=Bacillus coahuilensis p1.1.43 TaxID=1150625 RepID=A0A147K826_9BACI|nr:ECF transporter S component [Bacillus coahuilensis]KUP06239.1 riboflavin transporter FmnP [Bacillus coahuilensis p1.1.43]KUP07814.1 riboflavin transporter FmnP [Bacillus coahuilensis m2-6]